MSVAKRSSFNEKWELHLSVCVRVSIKEMILVWELSSRWFSSRFHGFYQSQLAKSTILTWIFAYKAGWWKCHCGGYLDILVIVVVYRHYSWVGLINYPSSLPTCMMTSGTQWGVFLVKSSLIYPTAVSEVCVKHFQQHRLNCKLNEII